MVSGVNDFYVTRVFLNFSLFVLAQNLGWTFLLWDPYFSFELYL